MTRTSGTYKWTYAIHPAEDIRMAAGAPRGRRVRVSASLLIGLALIVSGSTLLFLSFTAQLELNEIGTTDDPELLQKIARLEDQRDAFLVASIGTIFMGLFAVAMLRERSAPMSLPHAEMVSSARMSQEMMLALAIAGNATYLPAKHGLSRERVFVSSRKEEPRLPAALSDDLIITPGKDGSSPGILLEPFGLELLDGIEKGLGASVVDVGIEGAEGTLQVLKHAMGVMRDFHFKEREGKTLLRVEYSGLRDACKTVRTERPDTCRQMACVGCSCLLTAAARATGKAVSVADVDNSTDTVVFTLSMTDW